MPYRRTRPLRPVFFGFGWADAGMAAFGPRHDQRSNDNGAHRSDPHAAISRAQRSREYWELFETCDVYNVKG